MPVDYSKEIEYALLASKGKKREAARILGWAKSTFQDRLNKHPELIERYCSRLISDPIQHEADLINSANQSINGLSTYYDYVDDETGERKRGWIKSKRTVQPFDNTAFIIEAFKSELPRANPSFINPLTVDTNLCHMITLTDLHVGMYAWHEETGSDWDLNLAYKTATNAIEHLASELFLDLVRDDDILERYFKNITGIVLEPSQGNSKYFDVIQWEFTK